MNDTTDLLSAKPESPMQKAAQLIELERAYKTIKEQIAAYKADLLQVTKDLDVLSLKTGAYTISRVRKVIPRVTDFDDLKAALEKKNIPVLTKEVFAEQMSVVFKRAIDEGIELDGLEAAPQEYVMVRLAKAKEEKIDWEDKNDNA